MEENQKKGNDRTWMRSGVREMTEHTVDENQNKGNYRTWMRTGVREITENR